MGCSILHIIKFSSHKLLQQTLNSYLQTAVLIQVFIDVAIKAMIMAKFDR